MYLLALASLSFSSEVIKLNIEKIDYLKYEPIYLQTSYSGDASNVELGSGYFNLKCQNLGDLSIKDYISPVHLEPLANIVKTKTLNMIQYHEVSVDLRGWFISEPGDYVLWVETSEGTASNQVSISINMPEDQSDIEILEDINKDPEFYKFVYFKGGLSFQKSVQLCEKHIKKASKYQKHFEDFLVQTYSQIGYSEGELKQPNLEKALSYYTKIGGKDNISYGKVRSLHIIKRCLKSKKKDAKAYGLDEEFKMLDDRKIEKGQYFKNL